MPSFRIKLKLYSYITQNFQTVLLHHLSKKCAAAFKFLIQSSPPSLVASASFQNNSDNSFLDDTASLRKRQNFRFKKILLTYFRTFFHLSLRKLYSLLHSAFSYMPPVVLYPSLNIKRNYYYVQSG